MEQTSITLLAITMLLGLLTGQRTTYQGMIRGHMSMTSEVLAAETKIGSNCRVVRPSAKIDRHNSGQRLHPFCWVRSEVPARFHEEVCSIRGQQTAGNSCPGRASRRSV